MNDDATALTIFLVPAILMILVGVASVAFWRIRRRVRWRWFWTGAGLWAGAVAIKAAWALLLNTKLLGAMEPALPRAAYLALGASYVGAQSAICEIGLTLVAALLWRRLASDRNNAVAIGIGAGAFEAILLGVVTAISVVAAMAGGDGTTEIREGMLEARSMPLVWLIGPVERLITILCHISSRALVLLAVATKRWQPAAIGFALFAVLDTVGGLVHVAKWTDLGGRMWLIELALAPLAVASVPLIRWALARWPAD